MDAMFHQEGNCDLHLPGIFKAHQDARSGCWRAAKRSMHRWQGALFTRTQQKLCLQGTETEITIWALEDVLNEVLLTIETFYFYSMWKSLMTITIDAKHLVGQDARLGAET